VVDEAAERCCIPFISDREDAMRIQTGWLSCAAAMCLIILAASARAEKIKLDRVPKAVRDAVMTMFPKAKLTEATRETEGGDTFYELSFTYKDHRYDVECTPQGAFRKIERQLAAKELPKEVSKVLEQKYPKAKLNEILEVTKKDKIEYYEVALVTADKSEVEVQVNPKGKILKEEKKD
jgi:uncharacterized membrane protein YkoI